MIATPRSLLFVSGEQPARFPKAMASGADVVCIDLEDAVAAQAKRRAREDVLAFALDQARISGDQDGGLAGDRPRLGLRINGLRTPESLEDVLALARCPVVFDYLLVPKVEHPQDLALFDGWLPASFKSLVALIESPLGIEQAHLIAAARRNEMPRLAALMLGGADLSHELGARFDWNGLLFARGRLVNAAKAAGLQAWDVPHVDIGDADALLAETRAVVELGFDCKAAIHPAQVDVIHSAFAPSGDDVLWARGLLAALSTRQAQGQDAGAFLYLGKMVDAPILERARRILAIADGGSGGTAGA